MFELLVLDQKKIFATYYLLSNNYVSETWQFTLTILAQRPKPHYEITTLVFFMGKTITFK